MHAHDPDRPDIPLLGLYTGVVTDRDDPEGLGRVRIRIPGLVEEGTGWAFPLTMGGGTAQRGAVFTPPLGSEVGVMFKMGDVDQPYFVGGNLGRGEQLTGTDGYPDCHAIETENWVVVFDDRPGSKSLTLMDKGSGNVIQMNGMDRSITIQSTTQLNIQCQGIIDIRGLEVFIQGIPAGFGKV